MVEMFFVFNSTVYFMTVKSQRVYLVQPCTGAAGAPQKWGAQSKKGTDENGHFPFKKKGTFTLCLNF
jgi:hypothetical protein